MLRFIPKPLRIQTHRKRMKLVFHTPGHRKLTDAIVRMCKSCDVELEFTHDFERIKRPDYDLLIMNANYICPDLIPAHIKILYGPQHWVFPTGPIVGPLNPEYAKRAAFNALSKWNTQRLLADGTLVVPYVEFPFAVDLETFCPGAPVAPAHDCIVYVKRRAHTLVNAVLARLQTAGLTYVLFRYGSYNEHEYLRALRTSKFMVVLDAHESQGFALEEAMACNVPLLVVDATSMYDECDDGVHATYESYRPKPLLATSVPYWSDECGIRITDLSEFDEALAKMRATYTTFSPRAYVERELSPRACMERMLAFAQHGSPQGSVGSGAGAGAGTGETAA
jgi:hypothetical protein